MKLYPFAWAILVCAAFGPASWRTELPGHYFQLMEVELKPFQAEMDLKSNPGAMFAAAVLYAKQHPANPSFQDKRMLDLAIALGDVYAGLCEKDAAENKQDYQWEIHFWLDTYRLQRARVGP
jgi:hypothetical protein